MVKIRRPVYHFVVGHARQMRRLLTTSDISLHLFVIKE